MHRRSPADDPGQPRFPARYYARLLPWLTPHPDIVATLSRQHQLRSADLLDADTLLSASTVEALVGAALAASGRDDLGLIVGGSILPSSHEVLGHAFLASETLAQTLELAARYWSMLAPAFGLSVRVVGAQARVRVRPVLAMTAPVLEFHRQAITVAVCAEIDFLLGARPRGAAVALPDMPVRRRQQYREHLGWRLEARTADDLEFVLPIRLLSRRLALADPETLSNARRRCEQALARNVRGGSLGTLIRSLLAGEPAQWPRHHEVAKLFNLSPRSLARKLADEGARLRRLGVDGRMELARRRLSESGAAVTRIAMDLGYSDAANFARAFRRETGMSPREFRQRGNAAARHTKDHAGR